MTERKNYLFTVAQDIFDIDATHPAVRAMHIIKPVGSFEPNPDSNGIIMIGPNGSGKSLYSALTGELIQTRCPALGIHEVSMRTRDKIEAISNTSRQDESYKYLSTGALSFKRLHDRLTDIQKQPDKSSILMIDEPEIGIAVELHYALGTFLLEQISKANVRGWMLVSHSRELIAGLLEKTQERPSIVILGDRHISLEKWMDVANSRRGLEELF